MAFLGVSYITLQKINVKKWLMMTCSTSMYMSFSEFPHIAGCVDGTFIPIYSPHKNSEQYVNRHAQFSLNCQLMVNHRGAISHLSCQ